MSSAAYTLQPLFGVWTHSHQKSAVMLDSAEELNQQLLEIQVRSGDYFVTLATILDNLSQNLSADNEAMRPILERLILDLLYLQAHYRIDKQRNY